MLAYVTICLIFAYFTGNIVKQLLRNTRAHRFYLEKSKNLPVLPDPNIFYGHLFKTTYSPVNCKLFTELHKQYGKTFGFYMCEQAWVATTDLDLLKMVMIDQSNLHNERPRLGMPYKEWNDSIFQASGDSWRQIRRAVAPSMTNHKVRGDAISADIMSIVGQISQAYFERSKKSSHPSGDFKLDAQHMAKSYALAVLLLVAYNQSDVVDFKQERCSWIDDFTECEKLVTNPLVSMVLMFPFLEPLSKALFRFHRLSAHCKRILAFVGQGIETSMDKKRQVGGNQERFQRRLLEEIVDSYACKKISYEDLKGTLFFFFLAGFETTAATVTSLTWLLAQHPEVQQKLRQSIKKEGADSAYLLACINECLRWHPPVPMGIGRVLGQDVKHNNLLIPKGAFVMASIYCIHHDPTVWSNPEKFDPDRWYSPEIEQRHPAAHMPFGLGQRNCTGGKLAMHEIKLLFQMLLTNYQIERCESTPSEYKFSSAPMFLTIPNESVIVRMVPLEHTET